MKDRTMWTEILCILKYKQSWEALIKHGHLEKVKLILRKSHKEAEKEKV